jgi:hypothetical protein
MALDDLAFAIERSFLASEFLTWLWFRCETEGGTFDLPSGGLSVAVEDALQLASWDEDGVKASLRGGAPTKRPEAAHALAAGLLLSKARFVGARGGREWLFALDGQTLDLTSVKVVDPEDDEEPEDSLSDKLAAGEELRLAIDELYDVFLGLRLDDDWNAIEVERIRGWVSTKLKHAQAALVLA